MGGAREWQLQLVRVHIVQMSTIPHVRRNVRGLGNGSVLLLSAVLSERGTWRNIDSVARFLPDRSCNSFTRLTRPVSRTSSSLPQFQLKAATCEPTIIFVSSILCVVYSEGKVIYIMQIICGHLATEKVSC